MTTFRSLSRSATDRDAARRREPGLLESLAADPCTRLVLVDERGRVCLDGPSRHPDLPDDGLTPPAMGPRRSPCQVDAGVVQTAEAALATDGAQGTEGTQDAEGCSERRGRREPGDADEEVWRSRPLEHGPRLAPLRAGDLDLTGLQTCYLGREDPETPGPQAREPQEHEPQGREPGPGTAEEATTPTSWLAVLLPAGPAHPLGADPATGVVGSSEASGPHAAARAETRDSLPEVLDRYPLSALRAVGAELSARDAGLATAAVALASWHARAPYCPSCGTRTQVVEAGWARRCPGCASLGFPRTDPAVIMSVTDDADRLVLVHGASWEERRFSVVAGFVEAGECAEAAVVREVAEEVGLRVESVESVATQPWPFPRSLMLAYRARLAPGEHLARPDGSEVTDAVVLSREELASAVASGDVVLPGPTSIARFLIQDWYGGPLAG